MTLQATGPGGSASLTLTNYITVAAPPPVADFSGGPASGFAPLTVNFTNSSQSATSYIWHFGDSQTGTAINPTHIYTNAGSYTVSLQASGPGGTNVLTRTNYITSINIPAPIMRVAGLSNDVINLEWSSVSGATYRVQFRSDLTAGNWSNLPPDITATGSNASQTDSISSTAQRFYRVQIVPA